MEPPHAPSRHVLLVGRSLYLVAVEASLRTEPGVVVRRLDRWSPQLLHGAPPPDALIVESLTAHAEVTAALVAAFPEMLVIELAAGDPEHRRAIVRYGERRSLDSAHDLAGLIVEHGRWQRSEQVRPAQRRGAPAPASEGKEESK